MKQYLDKSLLEAIAIVSKEYRKEKGVTQENVNNDIKENMKVAFHIGRIEAASTNLSVSTLSLLCKYYNVSISEFLIKVEETNKSIL